MKIRVGELLYFYSLIILGLQVTATEPSSFSLEITDRGLDHSDLL